MTAQPIASAGVLALWTPWHPRYSLGAHIKNSLCDAPIYTTNTVAFLPLLGTIHIRECVGKGKASFRRAFKLRHYPRVMPLAVFSNLNRV